MTELYKKHRPKTLKGVVGNVSAVKTLTNMLERKTVPHSILFSGPSGCAKTTFARILKTALDCHDIDFKELNCSDFRGVDTIRDIARTMSMAPTGGQCRIWLLDEVHQMTKDAQNASLKILEDTPEHVYFFLCTTEPQKLIAPVKTRCAQIQVELLSTADMKKLLARIAKREKQQLDESLALDIVDAAGGSARKALVLLDLVFNLPPEARAKAVKAESEAKETIDLCRALIKGEAWTKVARILKDMKVEPETVRYAVLGYARAVLLNSGNPRGAVVIDAFADNFYDSKDAGLALACYEAVS